MLFLYCFTSLFCAFFCRSWAFFCHSRPFFVIPACLWRESILHCPRSVPTLSDGSPPPTAGMTEGRRLAFSSIFVIPANLRHLHAFFCHSRRGGNPSALLFGWIPAPANNCRGKLTNCRDDGKFRHARHLLSGIHLESLSDGYLPQTRRYDEEGMDPRPCQQLQGQAHLPRG